MWILAWLCYLTFSSAALAQASMVLALALTLALVLVLVLALALALALGFPSETLAQGSRVPQCSTGPGF